MCHAWELASVIASQVLHWSLITAINAMTGLHPSWQFYLIAFLGSYHRLVSLSISCLCMPPPLTMQASSRPSRGAVKELVNALSNVAQPMQEVFIAKVIDAANEV